MWRTTNPITMKTIKYTFFVIVMTAVIVFVLNTQGSTVEYQRPEVGTSTPVQVEVSDDVEKARKQIEEANKKLDAEEAQVLSDKEQASTTINAQIRALQDELNAKNAEYDAKLDKINEVRTLGFSTTTG